MQCISNTQANDNDSDNNNQNADDDDDVGCDDETQLYSKSIQWERV